MKADLAHRLPKMADNGSYCRRLNANRTGGKRPQVGHCERETSGCSLTYENDSHMRRLPEFTSLCGLRPKLATWVDLPKRK